MTRLRDRIQLKSIPVSKIKTDIAPLVKPLQTSMLEIEQKDPIKVREIQNDFDFEYEIVDGRRRLNALMMAGTHNILAYVIKEMDDSELAIQALVANSGTPNELDEAKHILYLEQIGYKGEDIAKMTGYSTATISQRKKLVEKLHPKGQLLLQLGEIKVSTALAATKLPLDVQEEIFSREKITYKTVFEEVRNWETEQLGLFDLEPNNDEIKPGLFLTAELVQRLFDGWEVNIKYQGKELVIRGEEP